MYIHYGENRFDYKHLAKTAKCESFRKDKPAGLWGSPENAEYGWKDWCESEDYHLKALETSFTFELSLNARVLHIHTLQDAEPYLSYNSQIPVLDELNLCKLYEDYDAMELHIGNDYINFRNNSVFCTWDVDSICVWNPDVVIPCNKSKAA